MEVLVEIGDSRKAIAPFSSEAILDLLRKEDANGYLRPLYSGSGSGLGTRLTFQCKIDSKKRTPGNHTLKIVPRPRVLVL